METKHLHCAPLWLVAVNHLLRQKNAWCEDEFLEMRQESDTKWPSWINNGGGVVKAGFLPSRSTWPRIPCGCCWGTTAPSTPRLCSSARFSPLAAHLSATVLQKGGEKEQRVCLGFNDFWTLDVLFPQSCAATVKWGRLKEKSIKRRRY